jgi:hypothetical protein
VNLLSTFSLAQRKAQKARRTKETLLNTAVGSSGGASVLMLGALSRKRSPIRAAKWGALAGGLGGLYATKVQYQQRSRERNPIKRKALKEIYG